MLNLRCIVLDIDDTLYLERDYVKSGFQSLESVVFENWQTSGFYAIAWRLFEEGARGNIFNLAMDELHIEYQKDDILSLVHEYRAHTPQIVLTEDARDFLDQIAGNYHIGVITDGPLPSQAAKAKALNLENWTKHIILTSRLGEGFGKPHPRSFELIQEQTGIAAEHCLYIADNPKKDFIAPEKLGWKSIRMKRQQSLHESLSSPDSVAAEVVDFTEVARLLQLH